MAHVLIDFPSEYWFELVLNAVELGLGLEEYLEAVFAQELTCPMSGDGLVVRVLWN